MSETPLPSWAPRQASIALGILEKVVAGVQTGQAADRVFRSILGDDKKYGSRDRRFFGDLIFAWFRWRGAIAELPMARGVCVAWFLDAREWPPALLALMADLKIPVPAPLDPATALKDRRTAAMSSFSLDLPPLDQWLPDWTAEETSHAASLAETLESFLQRPPAWIRVDLEARARLHAGLLADGAEWAGEASPCSYAFRDAGKVHAWLQKEEECLEIQDLASQQVARICAPQSGESWWDACCGAGGKSLHLLDESGRNLDLTCTDRREEALKEIGRRGRRHGLARTRRYVLDLLKEPELPNIAFDGILLDAPCSGQGTWSRNPDAPWRTSQKEIRQYARRQLRMLENVAPALKSGGHLIYAVCSLNRTETTEIIRAFLAASPSFALTPLPHPLTGEPTDGQVILLPSQSQGDGMFVARLRKG